ncbi:LCP family protein [Salipaludibacillus sp. CF4.18]|uniref:LCP family protein n=1 Tax=Salipaludibacillus sp. CF4.18 TaxID=3373081 RepID=UPI003EE5F60D
MGYSRINKKKKGSNWRRLAKVLALFSLIIVAVASYIFYQTYQAASESYVEIEKSDKRYEAVSISKDPVSVLLLGIEDYSSESEANGRADTIMVATFNPTEETLNIVTIPRDTRVSIPGRENKDKINHTYAFGGEQLTIKTVEEFLDIPIDYFSTVNFDGFKNIVDLAGGIEVDVPFDFEQNSDDPKAEKLQFTEGTMELDGRYALAYARMRMSDPRGDIGRNERQQEVIKALIKELTSSSSLLKVDDIFQEVSRNVQTNLRLRDGLPLFKNYSDFNTNNIEHLPLKTTSESINSVYYEIPDEEELTQLQRQLREHLELNRTTVQSSSSDIQ